MKPNISLTWFYGDLFAVHPNVEPSGRRSKRWNKRMAVANFISGHKSVRRRQPILWRDFDFGKLGSYGRSLHFQSNCGQYWSRCGTVQHDKLVVNLTGFFSLWLFFCCSSQSSFSGVFSQVRKVSQIIQHPNFNRTTVNHDIALLKLDSAVKLTAAVRPVCLPSRFINYNFDKQIGIVTGDFYF